MQRDHHSIQKFNIVPLVEKTALHHHSNIILVICKEKYKLFTLKMINQMKNTAMKCS